MLARAAFIIPFLFISGLSYGQHDVNLGLYFNNYLTSEEFKSNITRNPIGVAFLFLINKEESRFQYGIEVGIGLYSGKKYYYRTVEEGFPDNIEYLYEENGFVSYQIVGRYRLREAKKIIPYLEAKVGASTFFSAIRTMQVSEIYDDQFHFHDTALNIGTGIGSTFSLGEILTNKNWKRDLYFDLTATYVIGSDVRYRNSKRSELVESFEANYRNSTTSALHIKFGFILSF